MVIAYRVQPHGEELRTTVDKVRKRLMYAVDHHELHLAGPPGLQLFFVPQVLAWARSKWPEAFADIPIAHEAAANSSFTMGDASQACLIPGDPAKCQEALMDAHRTIHRLERELAALQKEADRLRPLAERYEQNRQKNRDSAKLPRNGR